MREAPHRALFWARCPDAGLLEYDKGDVEECLRRLDAARGARPSGAARRRGTAHSGGFLKLVYYSTKATYL